MSIFTEIQENLSSITEKYKKNNTNFYRMKKIFIKRFVEIALITLLFLGCVSTPSQTTTPPATTTPPTTTSVPAQFEITNLRVIPENPKIGDILTILVDVQNKGDSSGSYTILVTIGSKSKTQNIELEGKSSKTVQFQETVDTEGDIGIKAGNLTKTISVAPLETPAPTTPPATTPSPTTSAPTTAPPSTEPKGEKIERPEYELGTRLNCLYTVGGNEWGCTIAYNSPREGDRTPWFRWGVTDHWENNPKDTYWRGDYTYYYNGNWDLEGVYSYKIGGYKSSAFAVYVIVYKSAEWLKEHTCGVTCPYNSELPSIFPLVKGAEKVDTGGFCLIIPGKSPTGSSFPEGRGTYERRIYTEGFEDIEAGGETYRCARVKYYMKHTVTFLSPHDNEDWGKMEWIEEGYHWYADIGMVKTDVTIKTYWWDELEKTDKVYIILTGVTLS